MIVIAHHGWGEELLPALLASGGTTLAATIIVARAKLATVVRWLRRR